MLGTHSEPCRGQMSHYNSHICDIGALRVNIIRNSVFESILWSAFILVLVLQTLHFSDFTYLDTTDALQAWRCQLAEAVYNYDVTINILKIYLDYYLKSKSPCACDWTEGHLKLCFKHFSKCLQMLVTYMYNSNLVLHMHVWDTMWHPQTNL